MKRDVRVGGLPQKIRKANPESSSHPSPRRYQPLPVLHPQSRYPLSSFCKFSDLQSFNVRMFIVADARRREEFDARLGHDYFKSISDRVKFVSYDMLDKFYEGMMTQQKSTLIL